MPATATTGTLAAHGAQMASQRSIIVEDQRISLGDVILQMKNRSTRADDGFIDKDIVLVWEDEKRIVTGADILGRLLKGV